MSVSNVVSPSKQLTIARLQRQINHITTICNYPKPSFNQPFRGKTGEETWDIVAQANAGTGETLYQTYGRIKNQYQSEE